MKEAKCQTDSVISTMQGCAALYTGRWMRETLGKAEAGTIYQDHFAHQFVWTLFVWGDSFWYCTDPYKTIKCVGGKLLCVYKAETEQQCVLFVCCLKYIQWLLLGMRFHSNVLMSNHERTIFFTWIWMYKINMHYLLKVPCLLAALAPCLYWWTCCLPLFNLFNGLPHNFR